MAKVTIVIEDLKDGRVCITPDPKFSELMRRITSGDVPSTADIVASSALAYLRNKGKVEGGLSIAKPPGVIKPN